MKTQKLWALVDRENGEIYWAGLQKPYKENGNWFIYDEALWAVVEVRLSRVQVQEVKKKK